MSKSISEQVDVQNAYSLVTEKTELALIGMTCVNCAMNIEKAINRKVKGIVTASVNFATERAFVEFVPAISSTDDIIAAIKKAGYGAIPADETIDGEDAEQAAREAEIKDQTRKFAVGLLFALPLFVISMLRDFSLIGPWSHASWVNWLFLFLATPV